MVHWLNGGILLEVGGEPESIDKQNKTAVSY